MQSVLSVRFLTPDDVACPFVRYQLRLRAEPEAPYVFERERIRSLVEQVVQSLPDMTRDRCIDIVEVYTGNKYVAAIAYGDDSRSVILDYGFVELLVDNIGLEYLNFRTEREMRAWFAAGRPDDWQVDESFSKFEIGGRSYAITGSMMLRDVACKFLHDIVADATRRERLMASLLWRDEHAGRPNAPYFLHLSDANTRANVMPPFVAAAAAEATLMDQAALVTAFVVCHEIAHLVYSDEAQAELRASRRMESVLGIAEQLAALPVDDEGHRYTLGDLTAPARSQPQVYEGLLKEALIDLRAVEMLIEHERRRIAALDTWSTYLANLFGLISMTNSLGIFRRHLAAAIRDRSVASSDIGLARSEAVTRNLIVLAYLLHRHQNLAGRRRADDLLPKIHLESLVLTRRLIYFQLDLVANVGEDRWKAFMDSALA